MIEYGNIYVISVNWSGSDCANYIVKADTVDKAHSKILRRFPGAFIIGSRKVEPEIIS